MLRGFLDAMGFRGRGVDVAVDCMKRLNEEMDFDTLCFYPAGPEIARPVYEAVHEMGLSTGAMHQFVQAKLTDENRHMALGEYKPCKLAEMERNDGPLPHTPTTLDFTHPDFLPGMLERIESALDLDDDLGYLFLEYEGVNFVRNDLLEAWYGRRAAVEGMPPPEETTVTDATRAYLDRIGKSASILWTEECREMIRRAHRRNFEAVEELLDRRGFRGDVGVVYHLYGSEAFYFPEAIPSKDWWLVPWHYWTFEPPEATPEEIAGRKAASKDLLREWTERGFRVLYIGDVALGKNGLDDVREFHDHSVDVGLDGCFGLGLPDSTVGCKWPGVDDEDIDAARVLYRELFAPRG